MSEDDNAGYHLPCEEVWPMRLPVMIWRNPLRIAGLFWFMAFSAVLPAGAQSPSGGELLLNPQPQGYPLTSDLACNQIGNCVVTWSYQGEFPNGEPYTKFAAATVSTSGTLISQKVIAEDPYGTFVTVAPSGSRFALFWTHFLSEGKAPFYQWFDEHLKPRGRMVELPLLDFWAYATEPIPGGFVQLYPDRGSIFLRFLDINGHASHPSVLITNSSGLNGLSLAVDSTFGIITVAYGCINEPEPEILFRRFSLTGDPLTPELKLSGDLPGLQLDPSVATGPDATFVVVWARWRIGQSDEGIFGQRFTRDGQAIGPVFQVNQSRGTINPQVVSDATGNFAVTWLSTVSTPSRFLFDMRIRLFRPDGTPVGPELLVNRLHEFSGNYPSIAFAPNGILFIAWSSDARIPVENFADREILVRRFSTSPGDEPCIVGKGTLLCDTGRTGGGPEGRHGFGGPASDFRLLGDVDGDGREDPCVYRDGTFRCDANHEGGTAEIQIAFEAPGSPVPLLGDVDGDGREDPCLALPGSFSCDTGHDGGTAEITIGFGAPGETLLLGDLDGDGQAEACAFTPDLFRCDAGHNGGFAETVIHFGTRGDQPLLGDFDGDGRDDPCVFRKGLLLCDTAHNGGSAEGALSFGRPGDKLLLGNLDGL